MTKETQGGRLFNGWGFENIDVLLDQAVPLSAWTKPLDAASLNKTVASAAERLARLVSAFITKMWS